MRQTSDLETLAGLSEVAVLESWLSHELRCESPHTPSTWGDNDAGCTIVATHRIVSCRGATLICQSRAEHLSLCTENGTLCMDCDRPASECWQIVAV